MRRRRLLALAAGVSSAGCLGVTGVPRSRGDAVTPCEPHGADPDPREVCPGRDTERIVWSVDADRGGPVRMTAERRVATLPVEDLRFTLHNRSGAKGVINPYAWRLWRWTGEDWIPATDGIIDLPAMILPSGRSYTWRLSGTPGPADGDPADRGDAKDEIRLDGLAGGTYAFWTDAILELTGESTEERDERKMTAAVLVELRRGE